MKTDSKPQELPTTAEIRARHMADKSLKTASLKSTGWKYLFAHARDDRGILLERLEAADDVFVLITKANERLTKCLEKAEATKQTEQEN